MKRYRLISTSHQDGVTVLSLRPKTPAARLEFRAGQYIAVGFRRRGRRSPMRCFSIINVPNPGGELQIAFRRQGDFTHALAALGEQEDVFVAGPFGSFSIPPGQEYPLVYLASGIGITPFLSLLRTQAHRGYQLPTTLLYSCRSLNDIPFAEELMQLSRDNPWFTVRFLVTQLPGSFRPHPQVIGTRLTAEILKQYCHVDADYYICGSPGYAKHAYQLLESDEIMPEQIHSEAFGQGMKLGTEGLALQKMVFSLAAAALVVGVGGVFSLDAVRARGRAVPAATAVSPAPSQNASSGSGSSSSSSPSYSYAPSTAPTPAPVSQNNYYQPPVSSVS